MDLAALLLPLPMTSLPTVGGSRKIEEFLSLTLTLQIVLLKRLCCPFRHLPILQLKDQKCDEKNKKEEWVSPRPPKKYTLQLVKQK